MHIWFSNRHSLGFSAPIAECVGRCKRAEAITGASATRPPIKVARRDLARSHFAHAALRAARAAGRSPLFSSVARFSGRDTHFGALLRIYRRGRSDAGDEDRAPHTIQMNNRSEEDLFGAEKIARSPGTSRGRGAALPRSSIITSR